MTVAVVGGTGFLGSAIARALVRRGSPVLQIARGSEGRTLVPGARFLPADRTDEAALERIFRDNGVGAAIDVMTLTIATARPLLSAAARGRVRYVMISAIDVTANYAGLAWLERPPVLDRPTREDDPRRSRLYPYRRLPARPAGIDPDLLADYDKIPIEDAARADPALEALILRLPAIYGPGDPQRRLDWLKAALARGGPIEIDDRFAAWRQSMIYIEDAADAVARATLGLAGARVLHIAPADPPTMGEWATRFARAADPGARLRSVPPEAGGLMAERAEAMDLRYPLTLDGSAFEALLGPVAIAPDRAALAATMADGAIRRG